MPSEHIHLKMTVKGDPLTRDLFYIILFVADGGERASDFPIRPMRKPGDVIELCADCKGIIWPRCVVGPVEIVKASRQASDKTGLPLDVKVHHWMKAAKCGCQKTVQMVIGGDTAPCVVPEAALAQTVN